MENHRETKDDLVRQWVLKAEEDFGALQQLLKNPLFPNVVGFHSQQAAEKYLKALLLNYGLEFPKTHDLVDLLERLEKKRPSIAAKLDKAKWLSPVAVSTRYPGNMAEVTIEEAKEAARIVAQVRKTTLKILKSLMEFKK
jgi:HEPN domain-containing protein